MRMKLQTIMEMPDMKLRVMEYENETRLAAFSPCFKYRYYLRVKWDLSKDDLVVIGLNPSTADEVKDDPTVRRVKGFAKDMGHGGILMLNAFAYRSTDPKGLLYVEDPVGPLNTVERLEYLAWTHSSVTPVAAWGGNIAKMPKLRYRLEELATMKLDCFRRTKGGHPEHPLYLPKDLRPVPYNYEEKVP